MQPGILQKRDREEQKEQILPESWGAEGGITAEIVSVWRLLAQCEGPGNPLHFACREGENEGRDCRDSYVF